MANWILRAILVAILKLLSTVAPIIAFLAAAIIGVQKAAAMYTIIAIATYVHCDILIKWQNLNVSVVITILMPAMVTLCVARKKKKKEPGFVKNLKIE